MKRILVLLFALSVALSGIYAAVTADEGNVTVKLDLMKITDGSVVIGFSDDEVTDFTPVSQSPYADGYSLEANADTGVASNASSLNKLYVYAQITSPTAVDVYLRSAPFNGYSDSVNKTQKENAMLDWTVASKEVGDDFSVGFNSADGSEITSKAIISHPAGSVANPVSKVYCKELVITTEDFRPISQRYGANYWEQILYVTINSGS